MPFTHTISGRAKYILYLFPFYLLYMSACDFELFGSDKITFKECDDSCDDGIMDCSVDLKKPQDVGELSECIEINGNIIIEDTFLEEVKDLSNIEYINGNLIISGNSLLNSSNGFDKLKRIDGRLFIFNNESLVDLDGFQSLEYIEKSLTIDSNEILSDINGLHKLDYVGNCLIVHNNESLSDITGLTNLSQIAYCIYITGNDSLENIDGLENITSVEGSTIIEGNTSLMNINGLKNINKVGKDLFIGCDPFNEYQFHCYSKGNDSLHSITALNKLSSVGGNLSIQFNKVLDDIDGLMNLEHVGGTQIKISNNPQLSICDVEDLLDNIKSNGWTGEESLNGNNEEDNCI